MKKTFTLFLITVLFAGLAFAAELPFSNDEAIDAIVGEAAGEGGTDYDQKYWAMFYVAHAIRNRGTLDGVYGFNAAHNATEPEDVWKVARMAWTDSATTNDITKGSNSWGTKKEAGDKVKTHYLNHYFYYSK